MRVAICSLKSVSPYSQSRVVQTPKERDEKYDDYERRVWQERCHVNDKGHVFIPPMAFKNCLSEAAKFKSEKIPGRGTTTYTKHFEAGVLVMEPLVLPLAIAQVQYEWLFVPADGKRGGGKRVMKCFPLIKEWAGKVQFVVFDDIIDEKVFRIHLEDAGNFIGIGRFRPRNNGFYGRFKVEDVKWQK